MKKTIVIANKPIKLPFLATAFYTFLLYYFKVDNLWWGIFIALFSIIWTILIIAKYNETSIDIFNDEENMTEKRTFAARIAELAEQKKSKGL